MRTMRHIAVHVILLVMGLVLVPTQWLHDCEHPEHEHEASISEATCLICEHTLQPAIMEMPRVLVSTPLIAALPPAPEVMGLSLGFTLLAADRGPPASI
jgi:hypothetical protein